MKAGGSSGWSFALALCIGALPKAALASDDAAGVEFFESHVRPVLVDHCYSCHSQQAVKVKGGLLLDTRDGLLKGGDTGPAIKPGDVENSLLIKAVRYTDDTLRMPPKNKKLAVDQIANLETWIKMGAPDPRSSQVGAARAESIRDKARSHWAFQPIREPLVPAVRNKRLVKTPVDNFILARLDAARLPLSPKADKRALIRRATFDLLGLPPTPEEVAAFEADKSGGAFEKVVDRLLASPRYGERWGRHWLDVARYADTKGYVFEEDRHYPYAYTYRDYVIRAFNEDLPYDQFLKQQIAADLLPNGGDKRSLAALGYLTLGRRFLNNPHDIIDDRIDVVCRGMMALTVACARCHDHKFDPIPSRDYYSLYGVFSSSMEPDEEPLLGGGPPGKAQDEYIAEHKKRVEERDKYKKDHPGDDTPTQQKLRELQRHIDELDATSPGAPPRAMALVDRADPHNTRVFIRGNCDNQGAEAPREFLEVLSGPNRKPFQKGSGRLELAEAIASRDNPLTARVIVNRIWLYHFGSPLVATPSDFGMRSEPPTHPQLLDYLAARFMDDGWSIKKLHRLIMLSAAYQQSSADNEAAAKVDPNNDLLWRMNRQRLDFEATRDTLLAVAGKLDLSLGGQPVDITDPASTRRTVYGSIDRQNLPDLFRAFDFASPDTTSPRRFYTTVPQQALFMMNSPFVINQAKNLVARPEFRSAATEQQKVRALYQLAYQRDPDREESDWARQFLRASATDYSTARLDPWQKYAQVLLMSDELVFVD